MDPGFKCLHSNVAVTGGSGFVGQRLVEMLVERGAKRVVSFDIAPTPKGASTDKKIVYFQGDLTKPDDIEKAFQGGVECVYHIAALVGPYCPAEMYTKVNFEGTANVINACKKLGIKRIVMSSSPSTRFPYPDANIDWKTEDDLFIQNGGDYAPVFLQPYAESKAAGEKLCREACGTKNSDLLTIAVAPHQVYGPRDGLFLPNLLETQGTGRLRIFGNGENRISFCHADNYCHGLILGGEALYEGSPALGKFYIVTDGPAQKFWRVLDDAGVAMGFGSMWDKFHLPTWFMMGIAHLVVFFGNIWSFVTGTPKHVVNYKLKLNPFAVKMLVIHRAFNIERAERDLLYKPIIKFEDGWKETITWFKENWLPKFKETHKTK
jgi:nucleoside-diphosphate-sugar epimerase